MANSNHPIKVHTNVKSYKRKIITFLVASCLIISILLALSLNNIIFTIQNLKQIKGIIETKLFNIQEEMDFQNASFNFEAERGGKLIKITSKIEGNTSSKISLEKFIPYHMKGFYAKAKRFNIHDNSLEDQFIVKANKAVIKGNLFQIKNNVKGEYLSKIDPSLNQSTFVADEVRFFHNLNIKGTNLLAHNSMGIMKAGAFFLDNKTDFAKFTAGVLVETEDYKITSNNLDFYMIDGIVQNLLFKKNVVFIEKSGDQTIVYGDNALYDSIKSSVTVYGNVSTKTQQNNLTAKGESFYYNTVTKKGYLKGAKNSKNRVEINLEI